MRAPLLLGSSALLLGASYWYVRQNPQAVESVTETAQAGAAWVADMVAKLTRGERNNNPGNIRHGNNWQGEVVGSDKGFETFATPQAGIRALAKVLKSYHRQGFNTVRKIIGRYAPPNENDTGAYVASVARSVGVAPDAVLDLNGATLTALCAAIIRHENGRNIYSMETISQGVALA